MPYCYSRGAYIWCRTKQAGDLRPSCSLWHHCNGKCIWKCRLRNDLLSRPLCCSHCRAYQGFILCPIYWHVIHYIRVGEFTNCYRCIIYWLIVPWGRGFDFEYRFFKCVVMITFWGHFQCYFFQVNGTGAYIWKVNIVSGNRLVQPRYRSILPIQVVPPGHNNLTCVMLNSFYKIWIYITFIYIHIDKELIRWRSQLVSALVKYNALFILHSQYHGCCWPGDTRNQDPVSISDKASREISWSLEAARLVVQIIASLWILTGTSAAVLVPKFKKKKLFTDSWRKR